MEWQQETVTGKMFQITVGSFYLANDVTDLHIRSEKIKYELNYGELNDTSGFGFTVKVLGQWYKVLCVMV